jgi:Ca2+-binding RTX toxin-like protein
MAMATHFYFNGHTYEIEPAKLTWADADANATALIWDDDGAFGNTVTSYLANIGSAAESAAILKNLKASVIKGSTIADDGGSLDHLWIGTADNGINLNGQITALSGSDLLLSIIEWDGLIGTAANETLTGTSGSDLIDGNAGNDKIKAGQGNDSVTLGNGNNSLYGETTNVDSDDGNDKVTAGSGNNFLAPGTGDDTVKTGNGNNTVIGGSGNDKITTGSGDDIIDADGYYVDDGEGGDGNDTISTGAGNDTIYLGNGFDTVQGGSGNDTFVFIAIEDGSSLPVSNSSSSSNGGLNFNVGAASTSTATGSTSAGSGSSSSSGSTSTVTTIKDFNAGTLGSVVDQLVLDSAVFDTALPAGLATTNLLIGKGVTGPSTNETGIDDYLIFNTATGALYYDPDGNATEEETVLIAVLKGKLSGFGIEDISIV